MKKFICAFLLCLAPLLTLTACKKKTDYFSYVSEYRSAVYFYEDDKLSLKVYFVERETPYALDGLRGRTAQLTEVYFTAADTPSEVEVELFGKGGEMSYLSTTRSFYLSFPDAQPDGAKIKVGLVIDGEPCEIEVSNVCEEGTIDGRTALKCVTEYDRESFSALTENGEFDGEIQIRLIYDAGCYYYVGLCDKEGNVHAYLVDGRDGRIIAERQQSVQ